MMFEQQMQYMWIYVYVSNEERCYANDVCYGIILLFKKKNKL